MKVFYTFTGNDFYSKEHICLDSFDVANLQRSILVQSISLYSFTGKDSYNEQKVMPILLGTDSLLYFNY